MVDVTEKKIIPVHMGYMLDLIQVGFRTIFYITSDIYLFRAIPPTLLRLLDFKIELIYSYYYLQI